MEQHITDERLQDIANGAAVGSERSHLASCESCKVRAGEIQFWGGFMREHDEQGPEQEDIGAE